MSSPGKSSTSSPNRQFEVVLRSATPSESSPTKRLPRRGSEQLRAPEWNNLKEAIAWFRSLRSTIKDIVYRFINVIQDVMNIFENGNAEHYTNYAMLTMMKERLWNDWRRFMGQNLITSEFLVNQNFLHGNLSSAIRHMATPRLAPAEFARKMAGLRNVARLISIEGEHVWGFIQEAIIRLDERREGHEHEEQLPSFSDDIVSKAYTLETDDDDDGDDDDDEEKVSEIPGEGHMRDSSDLTGTAFDAIWIKGEGFHGEISDELKEIVGDGRVLQIAGSMRTILWLYGYDSVVDMIDSPVYTIEDEMVEIPLGIDPGDFLISKSVETGKLDGSFQPKALGFVDQTARPFTYTTVLPSLLPSTPSPRGLTAIYPWARQQCLPSQVDVVSIKHNKNRTRFYDSAHKLFTGGLLAKSGVLFRGIPLYALELLMTLFVPVISQVNRSNEFGPGMYTTNDFEYAKAYAGSNGAIMVFRDVDTRDLTVWRPANGQDNDEWKQLVAHYSFPCQADDKVPEKHKMVDIISGPVSTTVKGTKKVTKGSLAPDDIQQTAFVSYKAFDRLAASLVAIIYIVQ